MAVGEALGRAIGEALAPGFAAVAKARRRRVFHPFGVVFAGVAGAESPAGEALAGPVLLRIGGAVGRPEEDGPDVLGVALRFGEGRAGHVPGEVDLLLATFRKPWLLPAAFVTTDARDFLANTYWASARYTLGGREVELRAVPASPSPPGEDRLARLLAAVAAGTAALRVEADGEPVATVRIAERVEVDEAALRFSPYEGGRGLAPIGAITAMRRVVYPRGQAGRG